MPTVRESAWTTDFDPPPSPDARQTEIDDYVENLVYEFYFPHSPFWGYYAPFRAYHDRPEVDFLIDDICRTHGYRETLRAIDFGRRLRLGQFVPERTAIRESGADAREYSCDEPISIQVGGSTVFTYQPSRVRYDGNFLNASDIADALNVSVGQARRLLVERKIAHFEKRSRFGGGTRRWVRKSDLDLYIARANELRS